MIVYSWPDDDSGNGTGSSYASTLDEAREAAKEVARCAPGSPVEIERHVTGDMTRRMVANLLNGWNWCAKTTVVESWEASTCTDREVKRPCSGCRDENDECERLTLKRIKP